MEISTNVRKRKEKSQSHILSVSIAPFIHIIVAKSKKYCIFATNLEVEFYK